MVAHNINVLLTDWLTDQMTKYAKDTSLLVPEINTVLSEDECDHPQIWSQSNKLVINILKTKDCFSPTQPQKSGNAENHLQSWSHSSEGHFYR